MNRQPDLQELGQRIRRARRSRGLTLKQLGERIGLSTSYLSQIENAHANLHLRVLRDISMALQVPMAEFLQTDQTQDITLVRVAQRRTYDLKPGVTDSLLFLHHRLNLEATILDLSPGTCTGDPNVHPGDEFSYVLQGQVRIWIGEDDSFDLETGDIVFYPSTLPHRWENPFAEPAQVLITNTPPTY